MPRVRPAAKKAPNRPDDEPERLSHHWYLNGASGVAAYTVGSQSAGPAAGLLLAIASVGLLHRVLK